MRNPKIKTGTKSTSCQSLHRIDDKHPQKDHDQNHTKNVQNKRGGGKKA